MKNLLINALSTTTSNAINQTGRMLTRGAAVAAVASVVGAAVATKKTSEWASVAADRCESASKSMAQWLLKQIPVSEQK